MVDPTIQPWISLEVQQSLRPDAVLEILRRGNERFVAGERIERDLRAQVAGTAGGQHPMAAIVGCIDSRCPAELLFDLGIGDTFNIRLAGNVVSPKALGSLEYACKVAGSKLVLVLGHTSCGAVGATCDFVARGADVATETGLGNLPSITDPISEAVRQETSEDADRTSGNRDFVNRVAAINVGNMIATIRAGSPALKAMDDAGEIAIAGAMYDVTTGRVSFLAVDPAARAVRVTD